MVTKDISPEYIEQVRIELLREARERAGHDPEKAAEITAKLRRAVERQVLPRVDAEPTALRAWSVERPARFSPVRPAEATTRHTFPDILSVALGGTLPTAEQVALIGATVATDAGAHALVARMAHVTLEVGADVEDETAVRALIGSRKRPLDLETIMHGALSLEFAAMHLADHAAAGRAFGTAAYLWWGVGQVRKAHRDVLVAMKWAPTAQMTLTAHELLRRRRFPEWMTA